MARKPLLCMLLFIYGGGFLLKKLFEKTVDGKSLLRMVEDNNYIEVPNREENLISVIEKGQGLEDSYSYLALAFAYAFLGAKYRKPAIEYFEKYVKNPISDCFFTNSYIYSTFGKIYESEYDFDNAEKYYILYEQAIYSEHPMSDRFANALLGRLYLKISTQKALDYWKDIMKSDEYKNDEYFKRCVDVEYKKVVEKHKKGYVYKPRKKLL